MREIFRLACGGDRPSGITYFIVAGVCSFKCASIFLITAGSSIQAITFTFLPQISHTSISMLNTRFRRCAQVIPCFFANVVFSCISGSICLLPPLPRCAGVTSTRCLLFGARTQWYLVRLMRGLGINAARRAIKSSGWKNTWVVPSRYGVLS